MRAPPWILALAAPAAPSLAMSRSGRALLAYTTRDRRLRHVTRDAGL